MAGQQGNFDIAEHLQFAAGRGRSFFEQVTDILRVVFNGSKMTAQEYYEYGLFDPQQITDEGRAEFLGDAFFTKAITATCDREWWAISDDKVVSYTLLAGAGIAIPTTRAIYHSFRRMPGAVTLTSADDIAAWLRNPQTTFPIFGKPVTGVRSLGQVLILGVDVAADTVDLKGEEPVSVAEFATRITQIEGTRSNDGYLFQDVLKPHPTVKKWCGDAIGTIRTIVLITDDGPKITHTTWKIATGDHFADNFWREGNMVADVNPDTGEVLRVVNGHGLDMEVLTMHPDTGEVLQGQTLPDWDKVREMVLMSAALLPKVRFQGWDVGLCENGPVMVEANTGSSFGLYQIASGKGFMTPAFRTFLEQSEKAMKAGSKGNM